MLNRWVLNNVKLLVDYIENKPQIALTVVLGVIVFCLGYDHYRADARDDLYWKQQLSNCDSIKDWQAERYLERLDRLEYRARWSNKILDSLIDQQK
jgi:hypothetical protein